MAIIYSSTNKKKAPGPLFLIFYGVFLSRTFVKGRRNYKRKGCKHGHCVIEPGRKAKKKNQEKIIFQVDILHFVDILLDHCENTGFLAIFNSLRLN